MDSINIFLVQEGDGGACFRTKNEEGSNFRSLLVDSGETLVTQANIKHIAHGTLTPKGSEATLLVFEFRFISTSLKEDRRFKSAIITLKFEDAGGNERLEPEVFRIAPENTHALNPTTRIRDVSHTFGGGIFGGIDVAGAELGYEMELHETKTSNHVTRITGMKRVRGRSYGAPNTVIWSIAENNHMVDGIPTFLRTSVLLKRKPDSVFRAFITIQSDVDFKTGIRRLTGREGTDPVDPFDIDPDIEHPEDLNVAEIDLDSLGDLDLMAMGGVIVAKQMQVSA
ncbi:hypothetical protein TWF730_000185 [Orbilia blumenaviensis]|uniref:Uncharacterized protein n=1 Tax=Orbilia blumenaviensis TaxID=1796055 RepID=A0AAV9VRX5_9PEZI